ncbi:hypothetical protein DFH09DRAFT_1327918 [Mycena vulgaris]|nr:hypothetical protein DFH09DRAFT_1327918 [Mycena vulgaris]
MAVKILALAPADAPRLLAADAAGAHTPRRGDDRWLAFVTLRGELPPAPPPLPFAPRTMIRPRPSPARPRRRRATDSAHPPVRSISDALRPRRPFRSSAFRALSARSLSNSRSLPAHCSAEGLCSDPSRTSSAPHSRRPRPHGRSIRIARVLAKDLSLVEFPAPAAPLSMSEYCGLCFALPSWPALAHALPHYPRPPMIYIYVIYRPGRAIISSLPSSSLTTPQAHATLHEYQAASVCYVLLRARESRSRSRSSYRSRYSLSPAPLRLPTGKMGLSSHFISRRPRALTLCMP